MPVSSDPPAVTVSVDPDLAAPDVRALLETHLADMRAVSPPESVHALDLDELRHPSITFCVARDAAGTLLGVGALKRLEDPAEPAGHGEVKSMRTAPAAVRTGVASTLLAHLLDLARADPGPGDRGDVDEITATGIVPVPFQMGGMIARSNRAVDRRHSPTLVQPTRCRARVERAPPTPA